MRFGDWLTKRYIEWRGGKVGHSGSVKEFARQFGASQQLMSAWLNGDKVPAHAKYIKALSDVYGLEVYDVLGLPRPADPFGGFSPELRPVVLEVARLFQAMGPPFDRPEVQDELLKILKKYGAEDIDIT